jgi:hypothetical protein
MGSGNGEGVTSEMGYVMVGIGAEAEAAAEDSTAAALVEAAVAEGAMTTTDEMMGTADVATGFSTEAMGRMDRVPLTVVEEAGTTEEAGVTTDEAGVSTEEATDSTDEEAAAVDGTTTEEEVELGTTHNGAVLSSLPTVHEEASSVYSSK